MLPFKPLIWLAAITASITAPLHAQTWDPTTETTGTVRQATLPVAGPQQEQQEDVDPDKVVARTLDDHNKRLKAIEELAARLNQDQAEGTFASRLGAVEGDVEKSLEAVGDVRKSLKDYVKTGHGNASMKLSGRVHADYWHFISAEPGIDVMEGEIPQDRFGFRRLRFGVSGKVRDNMVYKIEMEFAAGNRTEFRDAYLGWTDLPRLKTVLMGNQKRPYGLDHLNSSRYNVFLERPFVIEANNQDARRLGTCSYGYSRDERYNWRFGVFNQELVQATGNYIGNDYQLEVAGRLATTWWWDQCSDGRGYGHLGFSGAWGWPDGGAANNQSRYRTRPEARSSKRWIDTYQIDGSNSFLLGGLEYVLNVGPTQFVAEYQMVDVGRDAGFSDSYFHGGYFYVSYFLTGEHMPWNRQRGVLGRPRPFENFFMVCDCDGYRQRGLGAWQIAGRYSHADYNSGGVNGGRGNSFTFALNWYWNPYARMQFNYLVGAIDNRFVVGEPGLYSGDYQIIGMRFMIDF